MKLSAEGLAFIKSFEGFEPKIYDDGVGVPTIGYGETRQPLPQRLTEPQAARLLARRLDRDYEPAVRALFRGPGALPFNQHRYDALVSFVFNLGVGAVQGAADFETIGGAIRARDLKAIAAAMPRYSNPSNPTVHAGLLRRRNAEAAMFRRRMAPFEGFTDEERAWIEEFDGLKKADADPERRRELKALMHKQAEALARSAAREPDGWLVKRRKVRHAALARRAR